LLASKLLREGTGKRAITNCDMSRLGVFNEMSLIQFFPNSIHLQNFFDIKFKVQFS